MSQPKILIVDDDPQIREILRIALERAGYATGNAADGSAALRVLQATTYDLIILDIGLPEMDGLDVCRTLRRTSETPVLFLTARDDEVDRILGLELGADDYVTKPFSPRELIARVKAILRRSGVSPDRALEWAQERNLKRGTLELSPDTHSCSVAGKSLSLTATEMTLLIRLMAHPENVVTRVQLSEAIYGNNIHISDRTIDSHIRNLRRKFTDAGCFDAIETLHGVGIRMGPCLDK